MEIHTRQLRYFMELAKCLNFTKAAMNLYIAQPALSQQVADLEKQLAVTLFIRNSRSVSLTPAGQILLKSCPEIFTKLENTQKQMLLAQAGLRGNLKIGFLDNFAEILPDILQQFTQLYPDIKVELYSNNLATLKTALHEGNLDVVFGFVNYQDFGEDIPEYNVLFRETLSIAIHKDHPFVTQGCKDYGLLNKETVLILSDQTFPKFLQLAQGFFTELGIRVGRYASNNTTAKSILIQVDAGLGISVLPSRLDAQGFQNTVFVSVEGKCWDFGVLWLARNQNAALPLFLDLLDKKFDTVPEK